MSDAVSHLRRCGSAVVQCPSVLGDQDASACMRLLECLRGLSHDRLECPSKDECLAFAAVCDHVLSDENTLGSDELISGLLAVFALGIRNGFAVMASAELIERFATLWMAAQESLAIATENANELRVLAAVSCVQYLLFYECPPKSPPEVREPLDGACVACLLYTSPSPRDRG